MYDTNPEFQPVSNADAVTDWATAPVDWQHTYPEEQTTKPLLIPELDLHSIDITRFYEPASTLQTGDDYYIQASVTPQGVAEAMRQRLDEIAASDSDSFPLEDRMSGNDPDGSQNHSV